MPLVEYDQRQTIEGGLVEMSSERPTDGGRSEALTASDEKWASRSFKVSVSVAFFWCIFGLSVIYGTRIWWDAPIHPSFVPFMGVGFAVIVAFAIVLTLKYTSGDIEFKLLGNELKGASGPIILWVLCFLAIVYGLYLLGIAEVFKIEVPKSVPLHRVGRVP
jgi:hypothetical protein